MNAFYGGYFGKLTEICTCHNCGCTLHYNPLKINIYSGGPFYCSRCCANVTTDIYGQPKQTELEKQS